MPVQSKQSALRLLTENGEHLQRLGVKRCGVFGSLVRNEAVETSDVDVLVEFEPERKTFDNFMTLSFFLEDLFGRRIDLVTTESLSPYIGPQILREVEYAPLGV